MTKTEIEKIIKEAHLTKLKRKDTERYSFSKVGDIIDIPNLLKVQTESYEWFINKGLGEVLKDISPIKDHSGNLILEFFDYYMEPETKYTLAETKARNATFSKRLIVKVRLINQETGEIKEQEIFLGDFPVMTPSGSFIINGAERVIVSQLVRSPGCYFVPVTPPPKFKGKKLYGGTIMPTRGAWIEFETDVNDIIYVRIDRTRKIPATVLLRTLGIEKNEDIIKIFGDDIKIKNTLEKDETTSIEEATVEIYKKLRPGELQTFDAAKNLFEQLFFNERRYDLSRVGRYKYNQKLSLASRIQHKELAKNCVNPETGEIIASAGTVLDMDTAEKIQNSGLNTVTVKGPEGKTYNVIGNGTVDIKEHISKKLYEKLEITEKVNWLALKNILDNTEEADLEKTILDKKGELLPLHVTKEDIFASVSYIVNLDYSSGRLDNIDHLGNRRVRSVGELLQNQFRIGLARLERVIRERMTVQDLDSVTPQTLINTKPITSAIREFFGSSPLSQFMDQTNPLSEITNKRRISALGPGGLSRDRASFEVRDVHYTHYGRLCPIESPEGPNIGLISALSSFALINKYGFIETPYRKIDPKTKKITDEVRYMSADVEDDFIIAQASEPIGKDGRLANERVRVRILDQIKEVDRDEVQYLDVSPKQLVSVGVSLIPFLENDDGTRALMGANMQRQAVPLIKTDSPIVGTGVENIVAVDSKNAIISENDGKVTKVTGDYIEIETKNGIDHIDIIKFKRTNDGTCNNQKPIVKEGDKVKKGEVIADGMATQNGELALGKNVLVGFVPWEGYNYEDAILINERLVREDVYTSVHIDEYDCECRDTKLGPEEITAEVPNVGDDALKELDEDGVIRIGAKVKPGDILVGKITPKGETDLTPEEKLLRSIFGEKSREIRDTSLRLPHGVEGTIVGIRRFNRKNSDELKPGVNEVVRIYVGIKRKIQVGDKMAGRHGNKGVISRVLPSADMPFLSDGTPLDIVLNPLGVPSRMNLGQVLELHLGEVGRHLGVKFATPVFDGAVAPEIQSMLEKVGVNKDGKTVLYDGRTGEPFENRVSVGIMYMLKLHHLVDNKIHARSTGTYSLVTQQPLGGKAQFGGQRFGEMEVWALEAYGASHLLREILTVKSDDVAQRVKTYEAIVKGENLPKPGIPESFKVLTKEMQGLGLNIELLDEDGNLTDSLEEEKNESTISSRDEIPAKKRHKNAKLDPEEEEELRRKIQEVTTEESDDDYSEYFEEDLMDEDLEEMEIVEEDDSEE